MAALTPVPRFTTSCSTEVSTRAFWAATARRALGLALKISLPLRSSTDWTKYGSWRSPSAASVEYAVTISSGDTASLPSVSDLTGVRWWVIPMRLATSTTLRPPMASCSRAYAQLTEWAVASVSVMGPPSSPSKFDGEYGFG